MSIHTSQCLANSHIVLIDGVYTYSYQVNSMQKSVATIVFMSFLTACGSTSQSTVPAVGCELGAPVTGVLTIATTVAPITSIVASIAGGTGTLVTGIVPEGTNSHTFEPKPSDAKTLETADIVFINGLVLEEPTKDCLLYTSPSPRDRQKSRMPSSA